MSPQYSPDGKFYWDGEHWVPVPVAQPRSSGVPCATRTGCLIIIGLAIAAGALYLLLGPHLA